MLSLDSATDAPPLGLVPGWSLTLSGGQEWRTTSRDYQATIEVVADATLTSATWTVVLDGLTDADHARLAAARPDERLTIALGWADAPGAGGAAAVPVVGALASMLGQGPELPTVVTGSIGSVSRGNGEFRYPTTVTGTDADHWALRTTRVGPDPVSGASLHARARDLASRADVSTSGHGQDIALERPEELRARTSLLDALVTLLRSSHGAGEERVVPAFLRDGTLHVGPCAGHTGAPAHRLTRETGLASVVADGQVYRATMVGRTDIGLGDACDLDISSLAPPDVATTVATSGWVGDVVAGIGGALAGSGESRALVVVGLRHRLNAAEGFVTELVLAEAPPADAGTVPADDELRSSPDPARRLASRLATRGGPVVGVGLVEEQTTTSPRPQRLTVLEGLAPAGEPVRAVRAALADEPTALRDKPYLTPFAFGRAGLVMPHYPGTRVVSLHPDGLASEAVVAGAVWPEGDEPASRPGDWWLSLPTEVSATESADDPEAVTLPSGPASHDLIDGDGRRAIHVAGFTLTVGTDLMPDVGTRPDGAEDGVLTIRHASGHATITIDADGNIGVRTDRDLTFEAGQKVTVQGQKVELVTGSTVEVKRG